MKRTKTGQTCVLPKTQFSWKGRRGDRPVYCRKHNSHYKKEDEDGTDLCCLKHNSHEKDEEGTDLCIVEHTILIIKIKRTKRGQTCVLSKTQFSWKERRGDRPVYCLKHNSHYKKGRRGDRPVYCLKHTSHGKDERGDRPVYCLKPNSHGKDEEGTDLCIV